MRAFEFTVTPIQEAVDLYEISMRPKNLEQLARQVQGVRVGMEFEMCVPESGKREVESEPEREREDEDSGSLRDIEDFFSGGGNNSRQSVSRLMNRLEDRWRAWTANQIEAMWETDKKEFISDYLYNNDVDGAKGMSDEEFEELVAKTLDYSDENYSTIYDEYSELKYDELTEEEFLEDEGLDTMLDVYNEYDHIVNWPYLSEPETISSSEIIGKNVAESFSRSVGVNAVYSSGRYRNVNKTDWRVEPDGSISTNDDTDAGLEFVTPDGGLPLDVMLEKMNLVKKWADDTGCYTNSSTGLHISVSVPNFSRLTIDYVKLVLLLGDNYVLDVFNRSSNTYAKSSFDYVNQAVRNKPEVIPEIFEKMRRYLAHLGAQSIASANTGKNFSVNFKDKYIEFRSPGGDWLDDRFWNEVKPTMLRFIVALDAASDPNKYREEYLKKLYKLLERHTQKQGDITQLFAKYVAGEMPRSALVRFVRQAQRQRNFARAVSSGVKFWWDVELPGTAYRIQVAGKNAEEAKQRALDSTPEWVSQGITAGRLRATPARAYDSDAQQQTQYDVYMADNPNQIIGRFSATPTTARIAFRQYLLSTGRESPAGYGYRVATS